MATRTTYFILLLAALLATGCSDSDQKEAKPGSIQATTEEIGHEAAQMIKAPIDKAQITADQENERLKALEERLNQNE